MTLIRERFSCEEMSKRALGEEWAKRSEAEQQEFTRLFQSLLMKAYAGKIEVYAAEPVRYITERITNRYATVRAIMYAPKNNYVLDFRLMEKAGNWLVYDIVVDGISLMGSYRGQFTRVLGSSSYETLVERMRRKRTFPCTPGLTDTPFLAGVGPVPTLMPDQSLHKEQGTPDSLNPAEPQ